MVTTPFSTLAKTVAASEGLADMCLVEVPHPMGMIPRADIEKKAVDMFSEIMRVMKDWQPEDRAITPKSVYPAERFQFKGTVEGLNRHFFEKGWSLGIPVIPPTPDEIMTMLKGTSRKPGDVIGRVPPSMATLTVELTAVYAVMAGCKPEYMPVLITALEALLEPRVNWRGALTTTAATQTVIIVNGPIMKEINLAYDQGAAGKGQQANGSIGYAINLIAYILGGSRPPLIDKSTLGSPSDYVCWVFGENEDKIPVGWDPLHVERGFKKSDSVVTVMACYPPVNNHDHHSVTTDEHLRYWSKVISPNMGAGGPNYPGVLLQSPIVALGHEHADLMASAGWTKDMFRKALWERARIPFSTWAGDHPKIKEFVALFGPVTPESMIPITHKPEQIMVMIAGGEGKHSHFFPTFPSCNVASKLIKK